MVAVVVGDVTELLAGGASLPDVSGLHGGEDEGVGEALFGTGDLSKAISMGSAWLLNALVAEWLIRRPAVRRARRARVRAAGGVSR